VGARFDVSDQEALYTRPLQPDLYPRALTGRAADIAAICMTGRWRRLPERERSEFLYHG
jgi:hypothetical protein